MEDEMSNEHIPEWANTRVLWYHKSLCHLEMLPFILAWQCAMHEHRSATLTDTTWETCWCQAKCGGTQIFDLHMYVIETWNSLVYPLTRKKSLTIINIVGSTCMVTVYSFWGTTLGQYSKRKKRKKPSSLPHIDCLPGCKCQWCVFFSKVAIRTNTSILAKSFDFCWDYLSTF